MADQTILKVGLVQMDCKLGDVNANIDRVLETVDTYRDQVHLLIFPELTLTGYSVGPQFHEYALRRGSPEIKRLVDGSKDITMAVGLIEESETFNFYNTLAFIDNGQYKSQHRKIFLPNYGIFEERKYFRPGFQLSSFAYEQFRLAPFICGDAWNPALIHLAAANFAHIFIFSVCSPQEGLGSKLSSTVGWQRANRFYSSIYGCYTVFVNRVGQEKGLKFWGQSEVIDPFGNRVGGFDDDSEGVVVLDIDLNQVREARTVINTMRDENLDFLQRCIKEVKQDHF